MFSAALFVVGLLVAFHAGECAVTFTTPSTASAVISPSVAEGTATGSLSYTAVATTTGMTSASPAAPATVTISLVSGTSWFSIASGLISTTTVLDYETAISYILYVKGLDNAATPASATVTLTVSITAVATDPYFGAVASCVVMADNSASGSTVTTLTATDPDGDTLTYSILAGSNTNTDFAISSAGVITAANGLYGTNTRSYSLVVYTADASLSGTTTLSVCVGTTSQCAGCTSSSASVIAVNMLMSLFALLLVLLR